MRRGSWCEGPAVREWGAHLSSTLRSRSISLLVWVANSLPSTRHGLFIRSGYMVDIGLSDPKAHQDDWLKYLDSCKTMCCRHVFSLRDSHGAGLWWCLP